MKPAPVNIRGFTLVEVTVVTVLLAILAASVLPALEQMDKTRRAGALAEIGLTLRSARSHAMASGDPVGVKIDLDAGSMQPMRLPPGGSVLPMIDAMGSPEPVCVLSHLFPGVAIAEVVLPDGSITSGTVWFASEGSLERRAANGSYLGPATFDFSIQIKDGGSIVVDRMTGLVQ